MPEIVRNRDVVIFRKGDGTTVRAAPSMVSTEWVGGQGIEWFDVGEDDVTVQITDGVGGGFILWGADEDSDRFTGMTRNQPVYEFVVVGLGGWLISTRSFEQFTFATRGLPSPTPIVYQAQELLFFSLSGLWTNEDEWTLDGDPRAPNENIMGVVAQVPASANNNYLAIHTF